MRCMRPAWRISTYSSRLEPVMARNLTRSRRGLEGSSASSRTRRLNCIHEWSRPVKSFCFCFVLAICVSTNRVGKSTAFGGKLESGGRELSKESCLQKQPVREIKAVRKEGMSGEKRSQPIDPRLGTGGG